MTGNDIRIVREEETGDATEDNKGGQASNLNILLRIRKYYLLPHRHDQETTL